VYNIFRERYQVPGNWNLWKSFDGPVSENAFLPAQRTMGNQTKNRTEEEYLKSLRKQQLKMDGWMDR